MSILQSEVSFRHQNTAPLAFFISVITLHLLTFLSTCDQRKHVLSSTLKIVGATDLCGKTRELAPVPTVYLI